MPTSKLTSRGLQRDLLKKGYKPSLSICEYIWNGFDAQASKVDVNIQKNELGGISSVTITDNGHGIIEPNKFFPVFESDKKQENEEVRIYSLPHGKKGWGRYTFFTFAEEASWRTIYQGEDGINYEYQIYIDSDSLLDYDLMDANGEKIGDGRIDKIASNQTNTGTKVKFTAIDPDVKEEEIIEFMRREFGWFIKLNEPNSYCLSINGIPLDYEEIIKKTESFQKDINGCSFKFKFILWSCRQNEEYSRYYLRTPEGQEKFSKTTTLNNKGDDFFHSIFVESKLFYNLANISISKAKSSSPSLFSGTSESITYEEMLNFLEGYLHDQRKPFIEQASQDLVEEFEEKGIFPDYQEDSELDQFKKKSTQDLVKQLYQVEPKIFSRLNKDQKKIFVRFLEVISTSGQIEKIFDILKEVIDLDSSELEQLSKSLKTTRLSNIVKTIQLIEDRYKVISSLKKLVYNKEEFKANEPDHLQKVIENNYWIFGEKYHLVSAEEPNIEQALRGSLELLRKGEDEICELNVEHPGRKKQMDVFMCKRSKKDDSIHHIVVELKHPKIKLGKKQLDQVEEYLETILSVDACNANNSFWEFYLVGNQFDSTGYIERKFENAKNHGERSLVLSISRYKIYVKTWSEVINEFDIRHSFLQDKLKLEHHKLLEEAQQQGLLDTADDITKKAINLTASLPGAVVKSKKQKKEAMG